MRPFTHENAVEFARAAAPPAPDGWQVWSIRGAVGPVTWSARPDGAPAAVIMNADSHADVCARIQRYERDVDKHLAEAKARLCAAEMSSMSRDEQRTARQLCDALCALRDRLEARQS